MDEIINTQQQSDCGEKLVLRTEGLVKRYGKRTVANGVTINVKQGEIVGLLGPNGAGKTTSFYMTTGLVVPNEGHVYLGDQDITNYPVYKRARAGIGYLPQEASVVPRLPVVWPLIRSSLCWMSLLPVSILLLWKIFSTLSGV